MSGYEINSIFILRTCANITGTKKVLKSKMYLCTLVSHASEWRMCILYGILEHAF